MISRFLRYAEKVFDLRECLSTVRDSRPKPRISSSAIFISAMMVFLTRRRSLNALEPALRQRKRLEGFAGKRIPSADRIGDVFALMATGPLREMLSKLVHRLGRNKALKTVWPLRAAAIDGHEFFSR